VKRRCKGSVGWGWCAVGTRTSRSDTPHAWCRQRSAHSSFSRDSQGRLSGGGVRTHMRSMVTGTARHSLQCPVDPVTGLLGPQHGLEASRCGGWPGGHHQQAEVEDLGPAPATPSPALFPFAAPSHLWTWEVTCLFPEWARSFQPSFSRLRTGLP